MGSPPTPGPPSGSAVELSISADVEGLDWDGDWPRPLRGCAGRGRVVWLSLAVCVCVTPRPPRGRATSSSLATREPFAGGRRRSSLGVRPKTARIVSLNWRTLAKPAAWATSIRRRRVVSIRMRAVCARWARASASGPAPSSAASWRVSWRSLYARRPREPGDALAVDDPVGDQPHRARGEVAAAVPLRRAGRGVGPAAQAGAEARALSRRGRRVEAARCAAWARSRGSSAGSRSRWR